MESMDNIVIDEDWGCVEPSQLFSSTGKTQSLRFLVDQLARSDELKMEQGSNSEEPLKSNWSTSMAGNSSSVGNGDKQPQQSASSSSHMPAIRKKAPPILKQKHGMTDRQPNLKRVTFEVEKFVVDQLQAGNEKESAAAQMAICLGAKPVKSKGINYKQLKTNRQEQKVNGGAKDNAGMELLRSLSSGSKKVQKKKSKKNKPVSKKMTKKQLKKAKKSKRK